MRNWFLRMQGLKKSNFAEFILVDLMSEKILPNLFLPMGDVDQKKFSTFTIFISI